MTVHPAIAAVRTVCLGPASWRMASIETWAGQQVRVWRALDPGAASGPSDPAIPVVAASGSPVTAIGFCAPVHGSEVPNGRSDVDAWRVDGESTERIDLRQVAPVGSTSQFGALFGPPGGGRAPVWAEGKIVFRHTERASGIERWFAIEVAGEALR